MPHSTQHRPDRDRARNKEIQDLRSENQQLKKQVRRLQKQLTKFEGMRADAEAEVEAEDALAEAEPLVEEVDPDACVRCGSTDITLLKTPTKVLKCCKACKHRVAA